VTPTTKLVSLRQAIAQFVPDGSTVVIGAGLESCIPFAAGHEIMRQRKRDLTLVGPISDVLFDQLIGAGCVRAVRAAWVGNVITGSGYNFRRAVEGGHIEVEDHSNLTVALALRAAAMGVPFLPARTALGSDLFATNSSLKTVACPFTGEQLTAVAALVPDVAILHVQRADAEGHAHLWGNFGVAREAALAGRHVIICAEEIVPPEVIERDPNRVVTPGFRVSAVVHAPWGAHPSPVPGHYNRDHETFLSYSRTSRTPEAFAAWQERWVDGVRNRDEYLALIGRERMASLTLTHHAFAEEVDYGY
jgi:glutaconate CoA-transferase, subunit A